MSGYAHLNAPEVTAHDQMMCFEFIYNFSLENANRAHSQSCSVQQPKSARGCAAFRNHSFSIRENRSVPLAESLYSFFCYRLARKPDLASDL